jgi:hypothetical protein
VTAALSSGILAAVPLSETLSASASSTPEWARTLVIALVTSVFTSLAVVILVEPVKVWTQRWFKKRELRRCLYHEMVHNYTALHMQVELAKHDPAMKGGIGERFAMSFKKSSYQLAQSDPSTYYGLGHEETYWIEMIYRDAEHIITSRFNDSEQHLRSASFSADELLSCVKNRNLSKKLLQRVTPSAWWEDIRKRLPDIAYVDIGPPSFIERLRRRLD